MTALSINHEIFVPREIIYDLWASADHYQIWFPALANAISLESEKPEQLKYTLADETELVVQLNDIGGTTRIVLTQSSNSCPELPNSQDDWHHVFAALENYLSAI